jgi:hypothetical protein
LIYVLDNIKDTPHGARGAPRKDGVRMINALRLADFLADSNGGVIPEELTGLLQDNAAHTLLLSTAEIRRLFDSPVFDDVRQILR